MASSNKLLPTLSSDDWVEGTEKKADYLLAHFFESDYSQTSLYLGRISSLSWVIQEGNNDMNRTLSLLRATINDYLSRYFESVETEVSINQDNQPSSYVFLNLYIGFTDSDGNEYTLSRLLKLLDGKLNQVIKNNNQGV